MLVLDLGWGSGVLVLGLGAGFRFGVWCLVFGVGGLGFGVWGSRIPKRNLERERDNGGWKSIQEEETKPEGYMQRRMNEFRVEGSGSQKGGRIV